MKVSAKDSHYFEKHKDEIPQKSIEALVDKYSTDTGEWYNSRFMIVHYDRHVGVDEFLILDTKENKLHIDWVYVPAFEVERKNTVNFIMR